MTTTNLPASIETATRAVVALSNDVDEVTVCLTMAFGLDFVEVPASPEKYGSLADAISRTAIHLDALAKTAEAASLKLRGATQPVRELPRPEPEQCQCAEPESLPESQVPAPETLTTPGEAVSDDDGEYDPVPVLGSSFSDDARDNFGTRVLQTDDDRKQVHDPGESLVVKLPPRQHAKEDEPQTRPRKRSKGKDARKK